MKPFLFTPITSLGVEYTGNPVKFNRNLCISEVVDRIISLLLKKLQEALNLIDLNRKKRGCNPFLTNNQKSNAVRSKKRRQRVLYL